MPAETVPFMIPLHEKKECQPFSLSTLFIGVSRKKINDYRVSSENPARTKGILLNL